MNIVLSKRLESIGSLVPKGSVVCDVGCDHALLPIFLVKNGICKGAVAMDVNEGPLKGASENIRANCLCDKITIRLSNGFDELKESEADCGIIAGMGGLLMLDILKRGENIWSKFDSIILSPHRDEVEVREYMAGICRYDTDIWIHEDGHFYCVMRFLPKENPREIDEVQRLLGINPTGEYIDFQIRTLTALNEKLEKVSKTFDIIKKQEEITKKLRLMEKIK